MASGMESVGWASGGVAMPHAPSAPRGPAGRGGAGRLAPQTPPTEDAATAAASVGQHLETQTELRLQVDAGSGRTIFQVVQQGTGEVVMQVPSDEVLGMSRRVRAGPACRPYAMASCTKSNRPTSCSRGQRP